MLEKAYIALQTLLVGIWMLQVILIKSDKDGNKDYIGSWGKGSPGYKMPKNLAELL